MTFLVKLIPLPHSIWIGMAVKLGGCSTNVKKCGFVSGSRSRLKKMWVGKVNKIFLKLGIKASKSSVNRERMITIYCKTAMI